MARRSQRTFRQIVTLLAVALLPLLAVPFVGWEVPVRSGTWHLGWFAVTYLPGFLVFFLLLDVGSKRITSRVLGAAWGIIAATPWCVGISLSLNRGYEDWSSVHTMAAVISSVAFGSILGLQFLSMEARYRRRHDVSSD